MTFGDFYKDIQPDLERLLDLHARYLAAQPLPQPLALSMAHKLRIELTHGSTAIEGNTLTLRETQLLIDEGITPVGGKQLREIHETVNHHRAVLRLEEMVAAGEAITEDALRALQRLLMANIDDAAAGLYRQERVMVTGAPVQPLRPELIAPEMATLVASHNSSTLHRVLNAAEAHYRFVKIHPFSDGNGRTARLLLNWILLAAGYPLTVIAADDRSRYIHSLDDADRGQPLDYLRLICECVERSLQAYLIE